MDAGLAAVLGAIVGVSGTVGSAWLGYQASRAQIKDQAIMEHAKRLREERREACLAFMCAAEDLDLVFRKFNPENCPKIADVPKGSSGEIDWALMLEVSRLLQEVQHAMFQAVARVDLAGPTDVSVHSGEAWLNILALRDGVEAIAIRREINQRILDQLRVEVAGYHDTYEKFMKAAQSSLQEFVWVK
ncbi:hypothetical protein KJK29_21825 [Streptomyces koelreuteriae]|uniref:Secreted protein n=1 Tax=Streptomyces koelreuteriae TaxID=2838015 RepID=A0ABX8FVH7_9ACTN|nr:hypothetical protein [Streptomyces koelreuteriae]QWB25002.1 hypothetical protein KJK29_21825 [Streptomyces koelreuteriae]UUA08028.1 hypothetical protein NNW98_21955 [Streptomyces koelreuteriae]